MESATEKARSVARIKHGAHAGSAGQRFHPAFLDAILSEFGGLALTFSASSVDLLEKGFGWPGAIEQFSQADGFFLLDYEPLRAI
jgi:hypothetical protein